MEYFLICTGVKHFETMFRSLIYTIYDIYFFVNNHSYFSFSAAKSIFRCQYGAKLQVYILPYVICSHFSVRT